MATLYLRFSPPAAGVFAPEPLLESLLARAAQSRTVVEWRAEALTLLGVAAGARPAVAAVAAAASDDDAVADCWVCIATPLHFIAGMSSISLPADGVLTLTSDEANGLAMDFNRVWRGSGRRMIVGRGTTLLCVFDAPVEVVTCDPALVAGQDVLACLPSGSDGRRLRQLMSEIDMWLFDHAVNRSRAERGVAAITGLWLWGGGLGLAALPAVRGWVVAGQDPLFAAYGLPYGSPDDARAEWGSETIGADGVVVTPEYPGSAGWPRLLAQWLRPAVAALRSGELASLELSARDRCFTVQPHWRWRFWRRRRSWWEYFSLEGKAPDGSE